MNCLHDCILRLPEGERKPWEMFDSGGAGAQNGWGSGGRFSDVPALASKGPKCGAAPRRLRKSCQLCPAKQSPYLSSHHSDHHKIAKIAKIAKIK